MKVLIRLLFFSFVVAVMAGCGTDTKVVTKGHFSAYPNVTVGQAFEDVFDKTDWQGDVTLEGVEFVDFSGKISKKLHKNFLESILVDSVGHDNPVQEQRNIAQFIDLMLSKELVPKKQVQELVKKYNCSKKCSLKDSRKILLALLEDKWAVGEPVEMQFILSDNGGFQVSHFASNAWSGVPLQNVLDIIYRGK